MDEEQVLSKLIQLFKLYFHDHGLLFRCPILGLWLKSGMDTDFFFTKALQWLLDLARVQGLPLCFRQCLAKLLMTKELRTEEHFREAIKLARLFNRCTKKPKRGLWVAEEALPLDTDVKNHFDRLKLSHQGTAYEPLFTELIQTLHGVPIRPVQTDEITAKNNESKILKEERQMKSLKRKSLLPPPGEKRAPVPHSVMIQRRVEDSDLGMQLEFKIEETIAEFEAPAPKSLSELIDCEEQAEKYLEASNCTEEVTMALKALRVASQKQTDMSDQAHGSACSQLGENKMIETDAKVISLQEIFSTLLTSDLTEKQRGDETTFLYQLLENFITSEWDGELTPQEMSDLLRSNAFGEATPNELKNLVAKSFVLSLNKHAKDVSFIQQVETQVFDCLVDYATTEAGNNFLLPVTQTLTHDSINPDQLNSEVFPKLTEFLKKMAVEQFLQNDAKVLSILRLIRLKCRSYSIDTAEMMFKYLESGLRQTGRLYCAQWLQLTVNQIKMQKDQWNSNTFPHADILTEIIATKPIILTLAGKNPLYFTHSINQPVLEILNHYKIKQSRSQWTVTKYISKLFGKDAKPLETLSQGWEDGLKEGLKYLSQLADSIPKAIFEAVDKVFVEQDNRSVLPACAEFICECSKRRRNSEQITMSSAFLKQLSRRLRSSPSDSDRLQYLECLHGLREWQELPEDIFRVYHLEVGAVRLLSVSKGGHEKKLVSNWGMDVPPNIAADVTKGILQSMKNYLPYSHKGYFLSEGIIQAFKSYIDAEYEAGQRIAYQGTKWTSSERSLYNNVDLIEGVLTAAANNGEVVPESLLSQMLYGFSDLPLKNHGFALGWACLENQSLPDEPLSKIWKYLRKTKEVLDGSTMLRSHVRIICASYLFNRELPTSPEKSECSSSKFRKLFDIGKRRKKPAHRENLIFFLFKKFYPGKSSVATGVRETEELLLRAHRLAEINVGKVSNPLDADPERCPQNKSEEEEEFQKFIRCKVLVGSHYVFRKLDYQRRLISSLRSNSDIRRIFADQLRGKVKKEDA